MSVESALKILNFKTIPDNVDRDILFTIAKNIVEFI